MPPKPKPDPCDPQPGDIVEVLGSRLPSGEPLAAVLTPEGEVRTVAPVAFAERFEDAPPGALWCERGRDGVLRIAGERSGAATPAYREGWDRIFGGKTPVGQA